MLPTYYLLVLLAKVLFFDHKPTPVTWSRRFKNQTAEQTYKKLVQLVEIYNGTSSPHSDSQLKKNTDQKSPITAH